MEKVCNREKLIPLLFPYLIFAEPKPILSAVCFPAFLEEIYLVLRMKAISSTFIRRNFQCVSILNEYILKDAPYANIKNPCIIHISL